MDALVKAVKDHAHAHYEDGGWDVVVETYTDAEIVAVLEREGATTPKQAIAAFAPLVEVWADRQAEADACDEFLAKKAPRESPYTSTSYADELPEADFYGE